MHLDHAVKMTGLVDNPYAMMHNSDCLVVSSDYEGQPMVILEALVIGLPVVTTGFDSVWGALSQGQGLVVDRTVDGLAGRGCGPSSTVRSRSQRSTLRPTTHLRCKSFLQTLRK